MRRGVRPERHVRPARVVALVLSTVLATGGLGGCSGERSYCAALKEQEPQLAALSRSGADGLTEGLGPLRELRDRAPDDIADEWVTLVSALQDLVDAVRASGAEVSDFAGGKTPPGVSAGQLEAVRQAAGELAGTRVQQAGASIEQHARDVCKVDLGGGLGGQPG